MKQNIVTASVILAALFFACDTGDKSDPEDPKGNIQISSTPAGAAVYLDNVNTGQVTPFTINDLDTGSYEIRVSKSGYFDDSLIVHVEDGLTATPSFTLTLLSAPVGRIFLESAPAGAAIFLDGDATGKTTPDTLTSVTVGDHSIKLTLANYVDSVFSVTVTENVTTSRSVTMREAPFGNAFISSTPAGAAIFVDAVNTTKITPDTVKNLSSGDHTVKLTLAGYFDTTFTVTVPNANQTASQSVSLAALPVGNLFISSTPGGAAIFLNGSNSGKVTPDSLKNLTPGDHTIKLTLNGYLDSTFTASVIANQTVSFAISMRTPPVGNLFISSTPSGAKIFRNGINSGKVTPDSLKNLSPGNYTIKLTSLGYFDSSFTSSVNADQTTSYNVNMLQIPNFKAVPVVIQTIFDNHCISCHSGATPPQGQNLSENFAYFHIVNVNSNQQPALKRIAPGDTTNSYLIRKVQGTPGITGLRMPRNNPPLSTAQIDSIRSWVFNGALPR